MLNVFQIKNNNLIRFKIINKTIFTKIINYLWIDIINATKNERKYIKDVLGQRLIKKTKLLDIESSARFYKDKNGLHIHSFFLYKDINNCINNSTVIFIIKNNKFYSLREIDLPTFRLYRLKLRNKKLDKNNPYELLLDLLDIKIEQLADEIEKVLNNLETLTKIILTDQNQQEFNVSISTLSKEENITSKIRICLIDTQRAIKFLIRETKLSNFNKKKSKDILRDIDSLLSYNESLFQKINFLLQSAMGFLNIEQNRIIKIFSVISVIFLPPTLLTSTYGMNFKYMPELHWKYGYHITLISMFILGFIPYLYFKFKKWLLI